MSSLRIISQVAGSLLGEGVFMFSLLDHVALHVNHVDLFRSLQFIYLHFGECLFGLGKKQKR